MSRKKGVGENPSDLSSVPVKAASASGDPLTGSTIAALAVVQLGTHKSFLRRVIEALRSVAPCTAAFLCFGTDDHRAYADSTRFADGSFTGLAAAEGVRLTEALGFDVKSVVMGDRSVFDAEDLYPLEVRNELPYFRDHGLAPSRTVLAFLHEGGVLFGVAGLHRAPDQPAFSAAEIERLEGLVRFVVAGARSQLAYDELSRESAALRALAKVRGTVCVVDRDAEKVVWAANRDSGLSWSEDIVPNEDALLGASRELLAAKARSEALPTPPRLPLGTITRIAPFEGDPVFGGARCVALYLEPTDDRREALLDHLSRREREIARLLVAGYSGVNVAAISGLSENTVRTYVRRLYGKLKVSNRAELVRTLMAPESATEPAQAAAAHAPPDSSLAYGDDTLD